MRHKAHQYSAIAKFFSTVIKNITLRLLVKIKQLTCYQAKQFNHHQ